MSVSPLTSPGGLSEPPADPEFPPCSGRPAPHAVKVWVILPGADYSNPWQRYTKREQRLHTWRWECPECGTRSFCTFLTAKEAERYGKGHRCAR